MKQVCFVLTYDLESGDSTSAYCSPIVPLPIGTSVESSSTSVLLQLRSTSVF